jgi:hypothetical protein
MNRISGGTARLRWLTVAAFAVAMAWMEAATVFYLRTVVDRLEPYQPNPLPFSGVFGPVELVREAATLVMLLTVGMLAGRAWRARLGYASIAFGIWDIFYYVFLRIMCGWPRSLFDWDILFLLPLPWWGPVLAPVCIALLMILWGTEASYSEDAGRPVTGVGGWVLTAAGIALALYVFMADSIWHLQQGRDAAAFVLPTTFNWPAFWLALLMMALPLVSAHWRWRPPSGRLPIESAST